MSARRVDGGELAGQQRLGVRTAAPASTSVQLAVADVLCAAADELRMPMSRRDAERLARRAVDLLDAYGYRLGLVDR